MSSIEDILNGEDSDVDDTLSAGVDLEHLLHSRDEHDDDNYFRSAHVDDFADDDTKPDVTAGVVILNQTVDDNSSSVFAAQEDAGEFEPETATGPETEATVSHFPDTSLRELNMASAREVQFLSAGKRDAVSALQSKRNSAALANYSNVRCDDLGKVSDQLRRNSAYKLHGPGTATAMTATSAFLAVGTSRGLVILFDHDEELRQVLGSNLPQHARPAVPITSIDAPKAGLAGSTGLEGLLVCGYASGEVALWDISKGAILKVINDLHTCSVATVSVLEAVSDGFTSLAGAPAGGDGGALGEHMFALPEGWAAGSRKDAAPAVADFSGMVASAAVASLSGVSLVVITADTEGVMYKTRLSKTLWSATYSAESECLLDSSTGRLSGVAVVRPLLRAVQTSTSAPGCGGRSATISCPYIASQRSVRMLAINVGPAQTWIVQTHPKIKIVYKWEAPLAQLNDGEARVPDGAHLLDWTWVQDATADGSDSSAAGEIGEPPRDWFPLLARSWGDKVQTLGVRTKVTVAAQTTGAFPSAPSPAASTAVSFGSTLSSFMSSSSSVTKGGAGSAADSSSRVSYQSKFSVHSSNSFPGQKVLVLKWTSCTELVILTASDIIVTNPQLQCIEQAPLAPSLSMELSLFHNRAVEDDSAGGALVLLQADVSNRKLFAVVHETALRIQLQSCFELADRLIGKSQWLEALALVLENARRSPAMLLAQGGEVDRYIIRYAELAVKNSAVASAAPYPDGAGRLIAMHGPSQAAAAAQLSAQTRNHYHLVSGVCIEYCVACARLDVLFSQVYYVFKAAQQQQVFLEALEPFILSREIPAMPPGVIAEFCECALRAQRLPSIERCVVYFEIAHLDMNFITKFLYENRMYSGFLYVFSNGLSDFAGAFQVIFNFMLISSTGPEGRAHQKVGDGAATEGTSELADIGYKLMLFLSYTFDGKVFPRGDYLALPVDDATRRLLELVTSSELRPMPSVFSLQSAAALADASRALGPFPYMQKLGAVDHAALIAVLRKGVERLVASAEHEQAPAGAASDADVLVSVLERVLGYCEVAARTQPGCEGAVSSFYDSFIALIASSPRALSQPFLTAMVKHAGQCLLAERESFEDHFVVLAEHQARAGGHTRWAQLRQVLRAHSFWIASLASPKSAGAAEKDEMLTEQSFGDALAYYLAVLEHPTPAATTPAGAASPRVFQYIDTAFGTAEAVFPLTERHKHETLLCAEVLKVLPALGRADLPSALRVVRQRLAAHVPAIIESTAQEPKLQFQLLHALISNPDELITSRAATLQGSFNTKSMLVYVTALTTYEPARVVDFLRTFESLYPLDECLLVCRQKGISEAVAFLMERTGEVLDALVMLLKDFTLKLKQVRRDIDAQLRSELAAQAAAAKAKVRVSAQDSEHYLVSAVLTKQDGDRSAAAARLPGHKVLLSIINCVADLCARNSKADRTGMWLMAFDHLLMERQTVRSGTASSSGEVIVVMIGLMLQALLGHMSAASAQVTPQEIIRRVTAQGNAAGIRLGEFKGMMVSMLGANQQELFLHSSMTNIIRADLAVLHRQKMGQLRKFCFRSDEGMPAQLEQSALSPRAGEEWKEASDEPHASPGPGGARIVPSRKKTKTRSYSQFFTESALPLDATSLLLLATAVPGTRSGPPAEPRRPGTLDKTAIYKSHM